MKFFTSQTILKAAGFTVLLALTSFTALAQGPTSVGYSLNSCYHTILPNNTGQTLNVLNLGEFQFSYSSNAGAKPDFIRIQLFNDDGVFLGYDYEQIGISDGLFNVIHHPQYGPLVAAYKYDDNSNEWVTNNNKFVFPDHVGSAQITTYHWTGTEGDYTVDPSNYTLNINLLKADEAFSPNSNNAQCLTFNNFNLGIEHNLDGFCGTFTKPVMTPALPIPQGSGFTPGSTIDIVFGHTIQIDQPTTDQGVPWCEDERNQQVTGPNIPYPVPSGCINFELKYELKPCSTADYECPNIEIIQPIKVCCSCDIRPTNPMN